MRLLRSLTVAAAGVVLAMAATALVVHPAYAATVTDCTVFGDTSVQGGAYIYQQNEWNSNATQCAGIDTTSGAWTITQANFGLPTNGAPATYPSSFKGCHWGTCTSGSGLPIQVSQLGSAVSSWSTTQVASGAYDVAYDIWFNSTPTTAGQPDGTEMMIWINSRGGVQPFGSQTGTGNLAGRSWNIWTGNQASWKIISYVLQGGTTSVSNLDILALIRDSVARGSLNPNHYLIDSEVGFEIWQGGQGLATTSYSFAASTGGGGDTTPPSAPTGLTVTGTTGSSVSLSWTAATDNVRVTGYDVSRGTSVVGSPTGTTFTDTGLAAGTSYTYTVRARDAAGNVSAPSTAVTATTTGGGGAGCTASYRVDNDWGSGFTATVQVTNTGTAPTRSWRTAWTFGGNQRITNAWNAMVSPSGPAVTATNASYNGTIAPGASTSFGFQAAYSGTNAVPAVSCSAG